MVRRFLTLFATVSVMLAAVVQAKADTGWFGEKPGSTTDKDLFWSKRLPYLSRHLAIEPTAFGGVYMFSPKQAYRSFGYGGGRAGVLLWYGTEFELSVGATMAKLDYEELNQTSLGAAPGAAPGATNNPMLVYSAVALWHPYEFLEWDKTGALLPVVLIGLGGTWVTTPAFARPDGSAVGPGRDLDAFFQTGFGAKYMFPFFDWAGVRFDMRFNFMMNFGDSAFDTGTNSGNINTEITGSVFGHFDIIEILFPSKAKKVADSDGDGVADDKDKCPEEPGPPSNKGCPIKMEDSDGDGVVDSEDRCPKDPGIKALKGCPDKDGDGIADKDDKCPTEPGPKSEGGCPAKMKDKDGDGIPDDKDKCPEVAEDKNDYQDDDGCPEGGKPDEGKKEAIQKYSGVLQGINFKVGTATLTNDSKPMLDQVAGVLKKYPTLKVSVEGHTDNTGAKAANQKLSQRRAESVRTYLISKGCPADNIKAAGYGPDKPIADNKTKAGKAKNRRIEFKISE